MASFPINLRKYTQRGECRYLLKSLNLKEDPRKLLSQMTQHQITVPDTPNIKEIFDRIRDASLVDDYEMMGPQDFPECQNLAVLFAIRILKNEIEDQGQFYNLLSYIIGHRRMFPERIRQHLFSISANKITPKQATQLRKQVVFH